MTEEVTEPETKQVYPAFSIFDRKAQRFDAPMLAPNSEIAIRRFGDMCDQEGSVMHMHAEDFDLWKVGMFDMVTGIFTQFTNKHIVNGASVQRKD